MTPSPAWTSRSWRRARPPEGQAQTLDHLFVHPALYRVLVQMRAAHVDAGWPADFEGDGPRGVSDHDP